MDPLFSSYTSPLTSNADDLASSLSTNLASINLNVGFQTPAAKKTNIASNLRPDSNNFISSNLNGNSDLPFLIKNPLRVQEFIPRKIVNARGDSSNVTHSRKNKASTISTFQDLPVASVPEFIPRGMSNTVFPKNLNEPEIVEILDNGQGMINVPFSESNTDQDPTAVTYQENVNGTVYFYTAPLSKSSNTSPVDGLSASPTLISDSSEVSLLNRSAVVSPDGTPMLNQSLIPDPAAPVFYGINQELMMLQQPTNLFTDLPDKIGDNYSNIEALEQLTGPSRVLKGYVTSTYKASHVKTGVNYFLRRIHNVSLPSTKCNTLANTWKKISHSNIVHLKEMFSSCDFGDNSVVFVYDFYPEAETMLARHFPGQTEGFNDTFSSDPNAPRPYSHTKNALLRQQHNNTMLSETTLWSYAIQLTGALRVIHASGLACRCLDPSKVIVSNKNRVRLTDAGVFDVILYDHSPANRLQLTAHFQQEDLLELGKLLLALTCGSLIAIQKENLQTSLEVMSRTYSTDLRNLIAYLLHTGKRRSILDLMPMIGARFYSQIDAMQLQCDILEGEKRKKSDVRRILQLLIKLTCINEWPDPEQHWAEPGDRYLLTLFQDYLYRQMSEDQKPWIDIGQIMQSLTKLLDGSSDTVCLVPREEESVLVMSYDELKNCFERSFSELTEYAAFVSDESAENGNQNTQDTD